MFAKFLIRLDARVTLLFADVLNHGLVLCAVKTIKSSDQPSFS